MRELFPNGNECPRLSDVRPKSPAKKLLGQVVADANTGQPFDWGRMALREFCVKGLLGWVLYICTLGIYSWVDSLMILGEGQRTLHDRMSGSVVRHQTL